MANAVWFISYKLKKGADVPEFLAAQKECNDKVLSRKKGFISWQVLRSGDTWVDFVTWETMEDAQNAEKNDGNTDPVAAKFYSFLDYKSLKMQAYSLERSY